MQLNVHDFIFNPFKDQAKKFIITQLYDVHLSLYNMTQSIFMHLLFIVIVVIIWGGEEPCLLFSGLSFLVSHSYASSAHKSSVHLVDDSIKDTRPGTSSSALC